MSTFHDVFCRDESFYYFIDKNVEAPPKSYLGIQGIVIQDSLAWQHTLNSFMILLTSVFLIAQLYLLVISRRIIKQMKSPQVGSTYCILTVCLIRSLQLCLIISIVISLLRLFFLSMYGSYSETILMKERGYVIYYIYMIITQLQFFTIDLVFFMQIIEWSLIIFIINEQKKLQESQITHLHTRETRQNTFKVGFAMNSSSFGG